MKCERLYIIVVYSLFKTIQFKENDNGYSKGMS